MATLGFPDKIIALFLKNLGKLLKTNFKTVQSFSVFKQKIRALNIS
jgi:hypothetical protein